MSNRFDTAWLVGVRERQRRGEQWQDEVRVFLQSVRDLGRTVIGRTRRRALTGRHDEDILALADASFVASGIERYRGEASPQSYYATIVARWTVSYLRPKYRSEESFDPAALEDSISVPSQANDFELRHDIAAALLKLYAVNASHGEAFALYYMEEFGSDAECAARLGIDAEAFRKRRERAKDFLRRLLGSPDSGV